MRILIEEYKYKAKDVEQVLQGIEAMQNIEGEVKLGYVGYYYNPDINDCVFILPKVLLQYVQDGENEDLKSERVFGKYAPTDIINFEEYRRIKAEGKESITQEEQKFLYEFVVWIYRAICVYNDTRKDNGIIYHKQVTSMGNKRMAKSHTFLDVLLALQQFNKENKNFITFTLKNLHSGFNKINWTKTIAHSQAIIQSDEVTYLNPVNKKRQINFDEELFVIYFSILNYIHEEFGFPVDIVAGFDLIKGAQFRRYLNGFGRTRLRKIKYKYFSDKALRLWELCYAFFDSAYQIRINTDNKEYLLAKDFNIVFESIIDELIGDKNIPKGLQDQADGKIVDHLFTYKSLIEQENDPENTYYIGDSKYYKANTPMGCNSVYKQWTYARNVIQWNLDLFLNGKNTPQDTILRDDITEGYNILPNFFISAMIDMDTLSYSGKIEENTKGGSPYISRQFENRLFDRDTLLICHYDVNFLHVLSLYARKNEGQKAAWKKEVKNIFRERIQKLLNERFDFYAMAAREGVSDKAYIQNHFQDVLGKVYTPFNNDHLFSLALVNPKQIEDAAERGRIEEENKKLFNQLKEYFHIEDCALGETPSTHIIEAAEVAAKAADSITDGWGYSKDGVLMVMLEGFDNKSTNFINNGQIAIGIKQTPEAMKIIQNINHIGYILFHTRRDENQHLYVLKEELSIQVASNLNSTIYHILKTSNDLPNALAIVADFDTNNPLPTDNIHSGNIKYANKTLRYDPQFVWKKELI